MTSLQEHLHLLLGLSLKLATISLSAWAEMLLRPLLRLLPASPWVMLRFLGGGGFGSHRWRQEARAEVFVELYKLVQRAARRSEEQRPAASYDSTVVYLPAIKLQVAKSNKEAEADAAEHGDDDDDLGTTYFESWAVLQEGHLQRSYISEALAQRMRLRQYPAGLQGAATATTVVDVLLKPLTSDVGLPLLPAAAESPFARLTNGAPNAYNGLRPLQMVVLPMEQFGRLDVRLPSRAAEEAAEAAGRPLTSPPRNADEEAEERSEGSLSAHLIIGQQAYCDYLAPYCSSDVRGGGNGADDDDENDGGRLAFLNFGPFGNTVVGGADGGEYRAYSSAKTIYLWVFALIMFPLYLLQVYLQLTLLGLLLRWKAALLFLNRFLAPATLATFLFFALVRLFIRGEYGAGRLLRRVPGEKPSKGWCRRSWKRFARWAATVLDDALLRALYWLLDGRSSVRELTGRECAEYHQYWNRWMRWQIINGLVPAVRAPPTPNNGASRSVHFADQHEFLPEESRAEAGNEGRRYRMVLRARALLDGGRAEEKEIRIRLDPAIDHSVITERAVARLGLRRHAIWPRFQWGLYPRDDDMSVCTEVVSLLVAPSSPVTTPLNDLPDLPAYSALPPLPVRLELQVLPPERDFTSDRPLPPSLRRQLTREFSVQLSDEAPAAEDTSHAQAAHHVDVVVGADQMYSAFFSSQDPLRRCSSYSVPVKDLVGIEIGLLRQTSTGFGGVFAGFEQPLNAKGREAVERKRTALEEMWKKMTAYEEEEEGDGVGGLEGQQW